ncbi:hypothetical protein [Thioalkalivibrio sp.]|uniref:hypothetical protein n=1 Tax=Thioalkalivibrio sp. TaxID=2093813 RepID=UPI003561B476
MTEPTIQRGTLWFWLIISIGAALALVGLGLGLEARGAAVLRAPTGSPAAGAFGFGLFLFWAAYAYALTAGRASGGRDYLLVALNLGLPLLVMTLWLEGLYLLAVVAAIVWSSSLAAMGIRLFQREAIAGLMLLPIFGTSLTAIVLSLAFWMVPEANAALL